MLVSLIRLVFMTYTLLLLVRVLGSWFPQWQNKTFMRFVAHYTDPYLQLFRRFIPPIGGMLDISPLVAFFSLQILEKILIYFVS